MAEVDVDFLEAYERVYELTAVRKGKLPPKMRELIDVLKEPEFATPASRPPPKRARGSGRPRT